MLSVGGPSLAAGITYRVLHPHSAAAPTQWYLEPHAASPKSLSTSPIPCEQRGQAKKVGGVLAPRPWVVPSAASAAHPLGSHTLRGKAHGPRCAQGVLCRGQREPAYCSGCWRHWETLGAAVWSSDKTWNSPCWLPVLGNL